MLSDEIPFPAMYVSINSNTPVTKIAHMAASDVIIELTIRRLL